MVAPVFWITGMSGVGKTTVAKLLSSNLRNKNQVVFELDGDVMREIIDCKTSHSSEDRQKLAMTYARFAKELSEQGIIVVCATISLFHQVHEWNRKNITKYTEVYLKAPREELERRDSKGIYSRVKNGTLSNVVGIDIPIEEPKNSDLIVENYGENTAKMVMQLILDKFYE